MRFSKSVASMICLLSVVTLAADDIPAPDQLKQLQTDKKWSELLAGTTRALSLKGDKAKDYDRIELLTLKAESQLQLKQFSPASGTFELASKEKTATDDQIDTSLAMSLMCKKVDAKGYKVPASKGTVATVIDIYDPANRKDAFKAMFDSIYGDLKKDADKNKINASLPALAKVAKSAKDLEHIERAGYGKNEQSKDLIKEMDSLAVTSIRKWLDASTQNVDRIEKNAREQTRVIDRSTNREYTHERGLDGTDRQALEKVISQCKSSVGTYKQFIDSIPEPSAALKELPGDIQRLHDNATNVLERVYN